MGKMMHYIMLSCPKATALIDKRTLGKLNTIEKMQLAMHTSVCKYCKLYTKQSALIDQLLNKHINPQVAAQKTSELERRILSSLAALNG